MRWLAVVALAGCTGTATTSDVVLMDDLTAVLDRVEALEARVAEAERRADEAEARLDALDNPAPGTIVETVPCSESGEQVTVGAGLVGSPVGRYGLTQQRDSLDGVYYPDIRIPGQWPVYTTCDRDSPAFLVVAL